MPFLVYVYIFTLYCVSISCVTKHAAVYYSQEKNLWIYTWDSPGLMFAKKECLRICSVNKLKDCEQIAIITGTNCITIATRNSYRTEALFGNPETNRSLAMSQCEAQGEDCFVFTACADRKYKNRLDKVDVQSVIRSHLTVIRSCYEKALQTKPSLSGRMTTNFTITGSGRVKNVQITNNTLTYPTMENCIISVLENLRFPYSSQNETIKYPFVFSIEPEEDTGN